MTLEGLTWFLTDLEGTGIPAVVFLGVVLGVVNEAVLGHLILTFPSGSTSSRVEVAVILSAYAISFIGGLSYLDTAGPAYDPYRCQGCTSGAVLLAGHPGLLSATQRASEAVGTLVAAAVIGLVIHRYASSTVAERRLLTPLWLSLGTFVLLTGSHLLAVFQVPLTGAVSQAYLWITDIGQLAVPFAFLVVVLRLRLTRATIGELILEIGPDLSFDGLRTVLARAVGDPSLEIGIWDPESRTYRDPSGRRMGLTGPGDARTAHLVDHNGDPAAVLLYDRALASDPRLTETIASALRMGAERAHLMRQLGGNLDELRPERDEGLEELTPREGAILALMAEGRSNEAICERLHIGSETLETHVSRIFSKLGLMPTRSEHRRVMAVLSYHRARNAGRNQG
jgi:DNA-binding CsgD family transcriptional regulator